MTNTAQRIYDELIKDERLKVFTDEKEDRTHVWLQFSVKNGPSVRIKFICRQDQNDVSVRVFSILNVDKEKIVKLYPVLNQLNDEYRFVTFCWDKDGDVNMKYDYLETCQVPESSARELVIRLVRIIDDAYPRMMQALWS